MSAIIDLTHSRRSSLSINMAGLNVDDAEWLLAIEAFKQVEPACRFEPGLRNLRDGAELLDYLKQGLAKLPGTPENVS